MENKFGIKPWNLSQISHPTCIYTYIMGHDATCWFLRVLNTLTVFKNIHKVAVVSNELCESTYLHVCKNQFIHSKYSPILVNNIEKRHKLITQNNIKSNNQVDSSLLLFLDRCFYKLNNEKSLLELFANQKANNLSICWTMLHSFNISQLVPYTDYAIIGSINTLIEQNKIHGLFASFISDIQIFRDILMDLTEYDKFIVIDLKSPSTVINEKIFYLDLKKYSTQKLKFVPL